MDVHEWFDSTLGRIFSCSVDPPAGEDHTAFEIFRDHIVYTLAAQDNEDFRLALLRLALQDDGNGTIADLMKKAFELLTSWEDATITRLDYRVSTHHNRVDYDRYEVDGEQK